MLPVMPAADGLPVQPASLMSESAPRRHTLVYKMLYEGIIVQMDFSHIAVAASNRQSLDVA